MRRLQGSPVQQTLPKGTSQGAVRTRCGLRYGAITAAAAAAAAAARRVRPGCQDDLFCLAAAAAALGRLPAFARRAARRAPHRRRRPRRLGPVRCRRLAGLSRKGAGARLRPTSGPLSGPPPLHRLPEAQPTADRRPPRRRPRRPARSAERGRVLDTTLSPRRPRGAPVAPPVRPLAVRLLSRGCVPPSCRAGNAMKARHACSGRIKGRMAVSPAE